MDALLAESERVVEGIKVPSKEWLLYYRFTMILNYYPNNQPQNVSEGEAQAIKGLREHHGFSIADLASIFQRSKATIHEVLNRS